MNTKIVDGKVVASIKDLIPWAKNPRRVEDKDLSRLEKQILQLGVYKPLLVTPNGTILGGNQRYKALKKLHAEEKIGEFIWVSEVDAWTDSEMLKYALSDNDSIGSYTREGLRAVMQDYINQPSLLDGYNIEIGNKQTANDFISSLAMSDNEFKYNQAEKILKDVGINNETLGVLKEMSVYNKTTEKLADSDIKGAVVETKFPIIFWIKDTQEYEQIKELFKASKVNASTEKLMEVMRLAGISIPTTQERLAEELKKLDDLVSATEFKKEINVEATPEEIEEMSVVNKNIIKFIKKLNIKL